MSLAGMPDWLSKPFAIFLIDLLLAGDNALVIALVCRTLPARDRRLALALGALGAVLLRVLLAGLAASALALPGLKLAGGLLLAVLALNLVLPGARQVPVSPALDERSDIVAAAILVTLFDLLMSLDNVLALAAIAGDSLLYLAAGLLLSVSIVMFGSALVMELLERFPDLERLGAALLGWVGAQMVVSDALLQRWIATQAPALTLLAPALTAAYVYLLAKDRPPPTPTIKIAIARPPTPPSSRPKSVRAARASIKLPPPEVIALTALFIVAGLFLAVVAYFGGGVCDACPRAMRLIAMTVNRAKMCPAAVTINSHTERLPCWQISG
jgi:YjbE family integral membrane protein